ncbi:flagellin [Fretibacterium fastidiosum]|uniref:Flagellin n=1 Tax=Fretibacterium fastidiosum TaxID=651822 RepID=A0AB94IVG5_9BACT|nr:flagellin [Fretibacterium fastidiosum]CBL27744.1 Flagellin and related hook-associated proteins [Fretibacterium fastidiosum]
MVVMHNIPALSAYNTVNRTSSSLQKSIQKLSTGLRINSAADDAAGLAISEKMRAQIRGLDRAVSNSQDGISMIQTAEGALNETHSILQRMRELSVQSANDTLTQQDRGYIQLEIDQLREEITRIGNTTQFNKKKLLNGDAAVLWSSDNLNTKAIINGGLRQIDQFGQKKASEGNYKIDVRAEPGQAEVKKSDIFKIKHKDVITDVTLNAVAGAKGVSVNNVPAGDYTINKAAAAVTDTAPALQGAYNAKSFHASGAQLTFKKITAPVAGASDASITVAGVKINLTNLVKDDEPGKVRDKVVAALTTKEAKQEFAKAGYAIKLKESGTDKLDIVAVKTDGTDALGKGAGLIQYTPGAVTPADAIDVGDGTSGLDNTLVSIDDPAKKTLTATNTNAINTNANILFEVTNVNHDSDSVTLKATVSKLGVDGKTSTVTYEGIVLKGGEAPTNLGDKLGLGAAAAFTLKLEGYGSYGFEKGSKLVYNVSKGNDGADPKADVKLTVSGKQNQEWDGKWGTDVTRNSASYGLKSDLVKGKDISFKNYYLNEKTGEVMEGTVKLTLNDDFAATPTGELAKFHATYVGEVARGDVKLRDLDKFWDSQGVFSQKDAKTLTITQGDGKQTSVTLYANDTLKDVQDKLNAAIGVGLGQAKYVDGEGGKHFVDFVDTASGNSESVAGTFVIRSVVSGSAGTISFSGDENIINALSLNVIQDATESSYTVSVKDAHSGDIVASNVQITGNRLYGVVNPNVDVEFDAMAGVSAKWDSARKGFVYAAKDYSTTLHLADNTTVFQIGANEGEDMGINIGDMRAHALGLNAVLVTDRESAARSITIIDNAIDKVSTQRAKLGAYQNRLEHTINNLNTAAENLTSAESRIRDTDMAKEMMNFTKLQIMLQAGTSMLAQANQLPQSVLTLIR